ncbi:NTP transferase domain-containing protein [Candidatus Pacearchaeota archaeon]|nr:NTP transferase domain-containing protein [Candidatus Pacearchaeota archaeon]
MKAIIINAGLGKRMKELTKDKPKCLIKLVEEETILGRQLSMLKDNGLKSIIILTGYFSDKIKGYVKENFSQLDVEYIFNPFYSKTNYIYTLSLIADEKIDDNVILMHGDMVFNKTPFKRLINSAYNDAVLMSKEIKSEKDFKGRVEKGIISKIGVNVFGDNCFFLAPIYKMSKDNFLLWLDKTRDFVKRGETKVYAENAFNEIFSTIKLKPVYFTELCNEIDTEQDLIKIKNEIYKR